jgi:hypothetical protein
MSDSQMSRFRAADGESVTSARSTWPCAVCAAPIGGRSHRRTCSPRCRQALSRAEHLAREMEAAEELARQRRVAEARRREPIIAEAARLLADKRIRGKSREVIQHAYDYFRDESTL